MVGVKLDTCSGSFWRLLFLIVLGLFFFFVYFLQTKILVLYAHMLNILFKICETDHLNRTGSYNTGGGKRDSFVIRLNKVYAV